MSTANDSVVIIGAGIIGCATAYYLSRPEHGRSLTGIHLVETSSELFSSASGKAGGFLAEDWFGPATASLGALSYRLHRELAAQHNGRARWGYSTSTGTNLVDASCAGSAARGTDWLNTNGSRAEVAAVHESTSDGTEVDSSLPRWLRTNKGDVLEAISQEGGVAQVKFLLEQSIAAGVQLHQPAEPLSLVRDSQGKVTHIKIQKRNEDQKHINLPCTRLLITAGAWTPRVFETLFPQAVKGLPITSLAGHSLVVRSPWWDDSVTTTIDAKQKRPGCHAVFTTLPDGDFSPEIFSRVGSEIYVAGLNDASIPLPDRPENASIDPECIEKLMKVAQNLLGKEEAAAQLGGTSIDDLTVLREGLCFRPVTPKGTPIVARIPENCCGKEGSGVTGGVFVAAGHGPWGISHSLGTGLVMAEMLSDKKALSADVSMLAL